MLPSDKALPRPLSSSTSEGHTIYQHFVTLHLLEAIKGACRDHSKGRKKKDNNHNNTKRDTSR
jgi:hypothetical protein